MLNRWQRLMCWVSGHGEGWALYAERLMDELGYLADPADRLGMLDGQSFRAARVIVDIGMHLELEIPRDNPFGFHPGETWTPALGLEFMRQHCRMDDAFIRFEVNRYLGWPGQAPSYKVGERIWLEARDAARGPPGRRLRPQGVPPGRPRPRVDRPRPAGRRAGPALTGSRPMLLVLASASPARLATLRGAGVEPVVIVSGVDESQVDGLPPAELALRSPSSRPRRSPPGTTCRARRWCSAATRCWSWTGSPSGKPRDHADAVAPLADDARPRGGAAHRALRPRHLQRPGRGGHRLDHCALRRGHRRRRSRQYVATGEPLHVAGAFTVDGLGGAFVSRIEGDHHNVVGVSLPLLRELLADLGHGWTALWRPPSRPAPR